MPQPHKYRDHRRPVQIHVKFKVGQMVTVRKYYNDIETKPRPGKVVYIHPDEEFAVIEFSTVSEPYREAFKIVNGVLTGDKGDE